VDDALARTGSRHGQLYRVAHRVCLRPQPHSLRRPRSFPREL